VGNRRARFHETIDSELGDTGVAELSQRSNSEYFCEGNEFQSGAKRAPLRP
jgi:hypothetical protein